VDKLPTFGLLLRAAENPAQKVQKIAASDDAEWPAGGQRPHWIDLLDGRGYRFPNSPLQ